MTIVLTQLSADAAPKTLQEAQEELKKGLMNGTRCGCCGEFLRAYRWKLFASAAEALVRINGYFQQHPGAESLNLVEFFGTRSNKLGGTPAKLCWWGLLERVESPPGMKRGPGRVGLYRMTDLGRAFCEGRARIPKYIYVVNTRVIAVEDGEGITVRDALGTKFDYDSLMSGAW